MKGAWIEAQDGSLVNTAHFAALVVAAYPILVVAAYPIPAYPIPAVVASNGGTLHCLRAVAVGGWAWALASGSREQLELTRARLLDALEGGWPAGISRRIRDLMPEPAALADEPDDGRRAD